MKRHLKYKVGDLVYITPEGKKQLLSLKTDNYFAKRIGLFDDFYTIKEQCGNCDKNHYAIADENKKLFASGYFVYEEYLMPYIKDHNKICKKNKKCLKLVIK